MDKATRFESVLMTIVYCLLPIAYIWTLIFLKKSLVGLIDKEIDAERRSVLIQFGFFLASYLTRLPFFIIQIIFLHDMGEQSFAWQLTFCIMYIPWSILPIGYIMLCHASTYK